jgi:hypothetical protein
MAEVKNTLDKSIAGLETVLKDPRDKLSISSLENQ